MQCAAVSRQVAVKWLNGAFRLCTRVRVIQLATQVNVSCDEYEIIFMFSIPPLGSRVLVACTRHILTEECTKI